MRPVCHIRRSAAGKSFFQLEGNGNRPESRVEAWGSGSQPLDKSDPWMLCGPASQPHPQLPSHFLWKPVLKGMGGGWLTTLGFPFLSKPAHMILALS